MNQTFIFIYYLVVLGSNALSYFFQFDISILWLAGFIVILYMYLVPDLFAKKRLKKNKEAGKTWLTGKMALILLIPILINCVLIFCFF